MTEMVSQEENFPLEAVSWLMVIIHIQADGLTGG